MAFTNFNFSLSFARLIIAFVLGAMIISGCQTLPGKKSAKQSKSATGEASEQSSVDQEPPLELLPNPYLQSKVSVPARAQQEFARAQAAMQKKDWNLAESILTLMTETYPNLSGPYVNLGIVYWKQDHLEDAEKAFKFAIEKNGKNMDAYSQLGIVLREQGKFTEAEQVYLQALKVWPHHLDSQKNLGVLYDLYMGKFPQALEHYKMARRILREPDRKLDGWIVDLERRMTAKQ